MIFLTHSNIYKFNFYLIFLILNTLIAQNKNYNKRIETDFLLGVNYTLSDYISAKKTISTKIAIKYLLSKENDFIFGPRLSFGSNKFIFNNNNLGLPENLSNQAKNFGVGIELQSMIFNRFYTFVNGGFSYYWFDFSPSNYFSEIINQENGKPKSSPFFDFNLGIKYNIYKSLSFLFLSGFHYNFKDNLDGISIGSFNDYNLNFSVGLSISLWSKIDSDGDGIFDDEDKCKYLKEDFDGFEDDDGCPDYDNDADGILDADDQCPNIPEDFDGFEDDDGCADYDNDGDGILDADDQCPNSPEDFDGFEDNDGCPDYDNDEDGILDVDDKCPDVPETLNGFEDDDGCPDSIIISVTKTDKTIKKEVTNKTIIPNYFTIQSDITFDRSFSIIQPNASMELSNIAQIMKQNPQIIWRIEGYTDNQKGKTESILITKKLAELIKNYLKNLGVAEANLLSIGMGDSFPIASNNTVLGRMKNRRVLIKRIN